MNVPLTSMLILAWLVFVLIGQRMATMVAAKTNNIHIVYLGEKKHHDPDLITDCHHDLLAKIVGSFLELLLSFQIVCTGCKQLGAGISLASPLKYLPILFIRAKMAMELL
ncbi:subtilisin-like protease SBT3.7 isoform X2 [Humulus lupulus]|uniref:subtilisin-like protease SBT3.7 isoform X2 n=1 Tax=Humulus lupulus TaxID=3486 RepID=UPI002B407D1B|nr:subtilisin-like protease SBT3.7 isoform X2 [Humulus lupulus]